VNNAGLDSRRDELRNRLAIVPAGTILSAECVIGWSGPTIRNHWCYAGSVDDTSSVHANKVSGNDRTSPSTCANVIFEKDRTTETLVVLRTVPAAFGESCRRLSSTPLQSSSLDCRLISFLRAGENDNVQMSNLTRIVLWMMGTLLSFSAVAVSIRILAGKLNIFEILSIRSGAGLLIMLALLAARTDLRPLVRPSRILLNVLRNVIHFSAQYCWAMALTLLPFATVFALEFITPAWTALLAVWLLSERLTPSRIGAVVLGLIGVVIILRPGFAAFNPAALLVLLAAVGFAITFITTKMLTATETSFAIIFWMSVIQLPLGLAGSDPLFPFKLGWWDIPAVLGIGIAGTSSHYCMSNAFRAGDATLVVPLDFLRVPLIALVGWAFFAESLDIWVFVGGFVIVVGLFWNLRAEATSRDKDAQRSN
jgi:drug/metabolite transporter (DMT)-like permease